MVRYSEHLSRELWYRNSRVLLLPGEKMRSNNSGIPMALLVLVALAFSQGTVNFNSKLITAEELLQNHHVAITKPALVAALRTKDDPQVRRLAAQVLADRWPKETADEIEGAMGK